MTNHAIHMKRALELARKGDGRVHPNPLVGCVLVKNGTIIGEGFHRTYGGPHAEQMALQKAGSIARGATAYVNLEPCNHWGKTPPCALALFKAGIKEVFVSHQDPNPRVHGGGLAFLKSNGIKSTLGLLKTQALQLNKPYIRWLSLKRPYVTLKLALTLDGKIASKKYDSKWITSIESRKIGHRFRAQSDAVLIGGRTAAVDNPTLSSHGHGRDPIRVVLDTSFKLKSNLNLFKPGPQRTWLITGRKPSPSLKTTLEKKGHKVIRMPLNNGRINIKQLLSYLLKNNVYKLFVEGGSEVSGSFIKARAVDEVAFFIAPKILGGRQALPAVGGEGFDTIRQALPISNLSVAKIGPDLLIQGTL